MRSFISTNPIRVNDVFRRVSRCFAISGRSIFAVSLLTTSFLSGIKALGITEPLERFSFDQVVRLQPDAAPDSRLLIVGITEADIQQYGWPVSDQVLTSILTKLQDYNPKVIGLDLYRSSLRNPENLQLLTQLEADNLIAIMNVGNSPDVGEVPPPPTVPWERVGFNDLVIDPDGILRRSLLFVGSSETPYYSFALRIVQAYLSDQSSTLTYDPQALHLGSQSFPALTPGSGGYQTLDDRGYQILLRYRARDMPARWVSVGQILSGHFNPEWIRGKVVLLGTLAPSLKDQFYTPYSATQVTEFAMSGVTIHAQIISQLLDVMDGQPALYRFWPQWGETLWLWGWTLIAGAVAWYVKRPSFMLIWAGLVLVGLWGIAWFSLANLVWLPIAEPMMGVLVAGGLAVLQKSLYKSTHDWLTGLPNREMFIQQVRHALQGSIGDRTTAPVIVAFLDIDRFKLINQSLGHIAGDQALLTIVNRLKQTVPRSVQLARMGGDEFAVLFQRMTREAVERRLNTLQNTLSEPFYIDSQRLSLTASLGIAITQNQYDHKPEDLIRDAHTAMYRAKALGKSRHEVFAKGMLIDAVNRLRLESDLLSAFEQKDFLLYYQPIVCLKTGRIAGFEALIRWQHQEQGFIPPSTFIPVAEETGLIIALGQWIFKEACHQLKLWQQQFPKNPLKMSINLSKRQFEQTDLIQQIETVLQEVDMVDPRIQLEITESAVMVDLEAAIDLMLQLKRLGLQLSIDDFGTGYSSLSYLHRFPIDTLKVDRSFVGRMEQSSEDRSIIQSIIGLGHNLGMDVVAEGIETSAQMNLLQQSHCEYGQGYFFSVPLSSADATALLHRAAEGPLDRFTRSD